MTTRTISALILALGLLLPSAPLHAESQIAKDTKQAARDAKKSTKKTVRSAKDKTCEWVDGKLECAGKKLKHKAENLGDDLGR